MEKWKDVVGYEGIYQVSNLGNIKSLDRVVELKSKNQFTGFTTLRLTKGKNISKVVNTKGYYQIALYKNGVMKNKLLHRLIAEAFIPNPENKPTVNHIDGNKLNDNLENLEWATSKEQTQHAIKKLNFKSVISKQCRDRQKELHQRKVRRSDGVIFNSIKEASMGNDLVRRHISEVCKGKRKSTGGYSWEYV